MTAHITKDLEPLATPIKNLKPADKNPRIGDIDAIMKSYERFGQRKPIVAHRKTKVVIAGNHQLAAATKLGWDKIAVVWVDDDDSTANAYGVADNRIGQLGEWNVEALVDALSEIDPTDLASTGFNESDYEDFVALLDEQVGSVAATAGPQSDVERSIDADLQVKKDSSYGDFLERYANRAVRAIILYYPNDEYGKMVEDLKELGKRYETDDNAETVAKLVQEKLNG
jgi:ParB-like chromosome segregation protein Spo0J